MSHNLELETDWSIQLNPELRPTGRKIYAVSTIVLILFLNTTHYNVSPLRQFLPVNKRKC